MYEDMNRRWTDEDRVLLLVELRLAGAPPSVLRWYKDRTYDPHWPWSLETLREDVINDADKLAGLIAWGERNKDWYPPPSYADGMKT